MFQLTDLTEVRLASVTNRVEKHGDDSVPAVSLGLELTTANTTLDLIDPKIREALYKAVEDQDALPGVEQSTPVLRCNSFERHTLPIAYEGWTLAVDDGIDETEPMTFGGAKVDKFTVEAKQGGSVVLRLRIGTSDVDADRLGKLAMHNGQSIWITLTAPEKPADAIDGTTEAFERDHPEADAGALFAQAHSGEEDDAASERPTVSAEAAWPFPRPDAGDAPVTIETSRPGTRTARGRERTKAALAAGMAQQGEAVEP